MFQILIQNKFEFRNPNWNKFNPNEMQQFKVLRKTIFHFIREIQTSRKVNIQKAYIDNKFPKETNNGYLYEEVFLC